MSASCREISIVIPTHDRPDRLGTAIESALAQREVDVEVVVVDDGSTPPAHVAAVAGLRWIRLPRGRGSNAARNVGLAAATGEFVAFLDDDDELLPDFAWRAIAALRADASARGAVCSIRVVAGDGSRIRTRSAPPSASARAFVLGCLPRGTSPGVKQSLVVRRDELIARGGFAEDFASRAHTELFLRLGTGFRVLGLPHEGYVLHEHRGARLSLDPALRQRSFQHLLDVHLDALAADPRGASRLIAAHLRVSRRKGQWRGVFGTIRRAAAIGPGVLGRGLLAAARRRSGQG